MNTPDITDITPENEFELQRCSSCTECPYKTLTVGWRGRYDSPFVIVGESPGKQEVRNGVPFIGPSGKLLWNTFLQGESIDAFVTNAIACSPTDREGEKDRSKLKSAAISCHDRLIAEVSAYPRKLILALGNSAVWSLTNNYETKITQIRGKLIPSPLAEYGILPAIHPAAILRGTGNFRQFKEDLLYAEELMRTGRIRTPKQATKFVCETPEHVTNVVEHLKSQPETIAADTETSGFNPRTGQILAIGFCARPEETFIIPGRWNDLCRPLLESDRQFIWHNGKFDVQWQRARGIQARTDHDTMLMSYALDESTACHSLEDVAGDVLGAPDYKYMVKDYLKKKTDTYENVPWPILCEYLSLDLTNTKQIADVYWPRIQGDPHLHKLYTRVLIPASEMLTQVEMEGIDVDMEYLHQVGDKYIGDFRAYLRDGDIHGGLVGEAMKRFWEVSGTRINPNSPNKVAHLLFDVLKLQARHGRSTRKEILQKLIDNPVVAALLNYRKVAKAFSTYVVSVYDKVDVDGRIHAVFLLHGTRTGRLSSRKPNLQNIPRDPTIRGIFVSPDGYIFIELDLNQAELRSLASLSGDPYLVELFNDNTRNLHDEMAAFLFPGWPGETNPDGTENREGREQRMRAKAVNFGIPYGREAPSMAEEFDVPVREAERWIATWFSNAPEAHKFILRCRRAARSAETLITAFGSKKRHWVVTRENVRALMNEASNFPHQNVASMLTLTSAIALTKPDYIYAAEKQLSYYGASIVNLVHDSILVKCPNDPATIKAVLELGKNTMRNMQYNWGITRVPFLADAKIGTRWGNLKKAA
jgi:DNA polymerase-1